MPKSKRCGACNMPIRHHDKRDTTKALHVAVKELKEGTKKPKTELDRWEKQAHESGIWCGDPYCEAE